MHAFISRTIIIIVIPLSMRQSYAVVVIVIVIVIVIGIGIIIIVIITVLLSFVMTNILQVVPYGSVLPKNTCTVEEIVIITILASKSLIGPIRRTKID